MSRVGNKPVNVPDGVNVEIKGRYINVKGPKGELGVDIPDGIEASLSDGEVRVERKSEEKKVKSCHGLVRALLANSVEGVSNGFSKTLEITGTGYKVDMSGSNKLKLNLGYSNPIDFDLPEGISATVEERGTRLIVHGINKQLVGEIASKIRKLREPDAYKGKGVRYSDERLKLKPGKAGAKK